MLKMRFKESPFRIIALLYIMGSLLFMFLYASPFSQNKPISFIDAWFLSTSAMSTTGLSTINLLEDLSLIGKCLVLLQIQLGGIGIMVALGILLMMFGQNASLSQQTLISFDQNQKGLKSVKKLVLFIVSYVFIVELIGFLTLYPIIQHDYSERSTALFVSLFQSISSFTGAGFDVFGGSISSYSTNGLFLLICAFLIFLGSIGYPTVLECLFSRGKKKSLYTKVNLSMHGILILVGFVLFFLFEFRHSLLEYSGADKLVNALFLSVTSRNAGIASIDVGLLSGGSILLLLILMFIGGSASSTAGGIRVTTFAVLVAKLISIIKRREDVVLFKKGLHEEDVNKSFLVFFLFLSIFIISCMGISCLESAELSHIMFEVMSALTTTGLSIGLTDHLSDVSLIWLSILMLIGRVGMISLIYSLIKPKKSHMKYTKEYIVVG